MLLCCTLEANLSYLEIFQKSCVHEQETILRQGLRAHLRALLGLFHCAVCTAREGEFPSVAVSKPLIAVSPFCAQSLAACFLEELFKEVLKRQPSPERLVKCAREELKERDDANRQTVSDTKNVPSLTHEAGASGELGKTLSHTTPARAGRLSLKERGHWETRWLKKNGRHPTTVR